MVRLVAAPRVSGIEKLQKIESLAASYLAQDDSVGTMSKRGFQEVANRHGGEPILFLSGFKPNEVLLAHVNLGRVLDQQYAFVVGDELPENV